MNNNKKKIIFKKWFTLIELLVAMIILTTVFWIIIKTIFWMNLHNIAIAETVQNLTQETKLQSFFTDNSLNNIIVSYVPVWDTIMYNKTNYANQNYKDMINNIVFSDFWLGIKKEFVVDLKKGSKTLKLPYLIFKDNNNKLGVIWFVKDNSNNDTNSLAIKIFFLNNNYYFKTKGDITISNLLYYYNNKSDPSLNKKYNNYINDLKLSWITLLNKIVIIDDNQRGQYNDINYITPKLLWKMLFILPTNNLEIGNPAAKLTYQKSIDNLWNSKLYYWELNIQYYRWWKIYWNYSNFLIK